MGETKANKVLSLEQLIAKKAQRDAVKIAYKILTSKDLGGDFKAKRPDRETSLEYMESLMNSEESYKEMYVICKDVVYNSITALQDSALHEAYNITEPDEIIDELFEIEEVIEFGTKIIDWNEVNLEEAKRILDQEVETEVKN